MSGSFTTDPMITDSSRSHRELFQFGTVAPGPNTDQERVLTEAALPDDFEELLQASGDVHQLIDVPETVLTFVP